MSSGRRIDAAEALVLRLVSTVVPRASLLDEARRYAVMVTQAERDVLVRTKAKMTRRANVSHGGTLVL